MGEADLYSPFMVSWHGQGKPNLSNPFTCFRTITSYPVHCIVIEMVTYPSCLVPICNSTSPCLIKRAYKRANENGRARTIVGRCAATDVVRSTASSFTLSARLSSTGRIALWVCKDERVCGYYKRVSRSNGHCALENVWRLERPTHQLHRNWSRSTQGTLRNHTHLIHQHHCSRFDFC